MTDKTIEEKAEEILASLTTKEKARLLYGLDFWYVPGDLASGRLSRIMLTDGPHGLRKQCGEADMIGLNESVPAVCYPSESLLACSWDPSLAKEIGSAIGEECVKEGVAVILGPGVNHKRDPLCGRNFEYFSEDPVLSGAMGAEYVKGVQSTGTAACVKHFACNSQENGRMYADSLVDERALREIYLKQFETILKDAEPACVMTAYNQVNGTFCSENKTLMTDIARKEWGYDGVFMTDWSGMRDQIRAYNAGLDLEMPGTVESDLDLERAVEAGTLSEETLNEHARRIIRLILKAQAEKKEPAPDFLDQHLILAERAAEESAVLLKNDGVLPFHPEEPVLVIGEFAETPRFQGMGSSKINPVSLVTPLEAFAERGISTVYAKGYRENSTDADETLIREAVELAEKYRQVVLFAGLPDTCESEGFDRTTLSMPDSHNKLIEAVLAVRPDTAVVLFCGAPVTMPWKDRAGAILLMYLSGCMAGRAAVSLITGKTNPCGKLAETFALSYADTPASRYYQKNEDYAEYRESIFTGYRWYDTVKKDVLFPFGHGLSYTSFSYSDLAFRSGLLSEDGETEVSLTVRNTGTRDGKETVQLYVSACSSSVFRPAKELKAFRKVFLRAGEEKRVSFRLKASDFSYYSVKKHAFVTEEGNYAVMIGASSRDIRLRGEIRCEGCAAEETEEKTLWPAYYDAKALSGEIPAEQFYALAGLTPPKERDRSVITEYSIIRDLQYSKGGKAMYEQLIGKAKSNPDKKTAETNLKVALGMPVMCMFMGNKPRSVVDAYIRRMNTDPEDQKN